VQPLRGVIKFGNDQYCNPFVEWSS